MRDSQLNGSERHVQRKFRLVSSVGLLLLPILILLAADGLRALPDRLPLPARSAAVHFAPLQVPGTVGAWTVSVEDPRFGGVSALALEGSRLLALTDSAVLVSLPRPDAGRQAHLRELPAGPGAPTQRRFRDSEALLRDDAGHWWVAFENRHSLWRYDPELTRAEARVGLGGRGWALNKGVEAMVAGESDGLLLLPEPATEALEASPRGLSGKRMAPGKGEFADAVRLPDGRVLVLVRQVGMVGIANWIGELRGDGAGWRVELLRRVPVGPLTNLEAAAAERLPSGRTRLWLMSDNDFSDLRRTVLLAIDLEPVPRT